SVAHARGILIGVVPYAVYVTLRNPLDALSASPKNSINLSVALLVTVTTVWIGSGTVSPALVMGLSLWPLGVLTWRSWRQLAPAAAVSSAPGIAMAERAVGETL